MFPGGYPASQQEMGDENGMEEDLSDHQPRDGGWEEQKELVPGVKVTTVEKLTWDVQSS